MSEYQYYEFQALDRPLTQEQISKLRAYSSFLGIDADLIAAAAERSADQEVPIPSRKEIGDVRDLHDLAEMQGKGRDFKSRMGALQRENSAKSTLIERLRKGKLLGGVA